MILIDQVKSTTKFQVFLLLKEKCIICRQRARDVFSAKQLLVTNRIACFDLHFPFQNQNRRHATQNATA